MNSKLCTLILVPLYLAACGGAQSASSNLHAAAAKAPVKSVALPLAAKIDNKDALAAMQAAYPAVGKQAKELLQNVKAADLTPTLAKRFVAAQKSVEAFACKHTDLGDCGSGIDYVLSTEVPGTFVGFIVYAEGDDDADRYSGTALAYYSPTGALLDIETRASGIGDSDNAGDWSHVDLKALAAVQATLSQAVEFNVQQPEVKLVNAKAPKVDSSSLPFAALVKEVQTELQSTTYAHSDQGDDMVEFVSINNPDGSLAGYVLATFGGDDSDNWASAAYATFSANGQLLDRHISSSGYADTMTDDSVAYLTTLGQ